MIVDRETYCDECGRRTRAPEMEYEYYRRNCLETKVLCRRCVREGYYIDPNGAIRYEAPAREE